jgi:hypothetical protein
MTCITYASDKETIMLNTKKLLTKILTELFYTRTLNPSGYAFNGGQYRSIDTTSIAKTGYTPFVLKCTCSNKTSIRITNYFVSSGKVTFEAINTSDTDLTGVSFVIQLLYIKSELVNAL